jgi:uncharacterized protein YndB with AHSA1/START domain
MRPSPVSAVHGTFTIARELPHSPQRVFAAWSDPEAKAAWFSAPTDENRMTLTEQGAFLDGYDDAGSRERGTGALMDQLAKSLET